MGQGRTAVGAHRRAETVLPAHFIPSGTVRTRFPAQSTRVYTPAERGFTIAELITVVAIIGILSAMALPIVRFGQQRQKELELRGRLRKVTESIDRYHDLKVKQQLKLRESLDQGDYPKELSELIEGVEKLDGKKIKFLRPRDIIDPMTGREFATVSSTDELDAASTNKKNVFDVRSNSSRTSLDGKTHYNEW